MATRAIVATSSGTSATILWPGGIVTWACTSFTITGGPITAGTPSASTGGLTLYNENNEHAAAIQGANISGSTKNFQLPNLSGTFALVDAAQSWTAAQTYGDGYLKLSGATSGASTLKAPAVASSYTHTLPAATTTLAGISFAQAWTAAQTFGDGYLLLAGATSGAATLKAPAIASTYTLTLPAATTTLMGWQDALRKDYIWLRDEFIGGSNAVSNYGPIGELGWSGGNIVAANQSDFIVGEANHWGIFRIKSGSTSGNGATLSLNFGASFSENGRFPALNATTGWYLRFVVRPESITSVDMRIGLTDDFNGDPPSNGIWWEFESASDTKWTPVCRSGGAETEGSTTNSVNAGAGTWVTLDIYCTSNGVISFSADGGTAITINTDVPSANLSPCLIVKTSTGASRYLDIDFFAMQMTVSR